MSKKISEKQQKINDQLGEELQSRDQEIVLEAIRKIKSVGHVELIPLLIQKWFTSEGEIENSLTELLFSLKDESVIPALIQQLQNEKSPENRAKLISIFWNSGFEPKDELSLFVKIAVEGSFFEAFEALTLIETMEDPFPEEELMESLLLLKNYFAEEKNKEDQKYSLLRTMATYLSVSDEYQIE